MARVPQEARFVSGIAMRAVLERIIEHARETFPRECCGMLLGKADRVIDAVRARNLADEPHRFLIDPKDHIDAMREARRRQLDVVGFYHSHPQTAAVPSASDRAEAAYPEHLYLIVSLANAQAEARLFRFVDGDFEEVGLAADF